MYAECTSNEISADEDVFKMPAKLRQTNYFLASKTNSNAGTNMAINHINNNVNSVHLHFDKLVSAKNNLWRAEVFGLKWLQEKIDNCEIDIC